MLAPLSSMKCASVVDLNSFASISRLRDIETDSARIDAAANRKRVAESIPC